MNKFWNFIHKLTCWYPRYDYHTSVDQDWEVCRMCGHKNITGKGYGQFDHY